MEKVKIEVELSLATKFQVQLVRKILKGELFFIDSLLNSSHKKNRIVDCVYNGDDLFSERVGEIIKKIGSVT